MTARKSKNLVNANLLKIDENGRFVKFQTQKSAYVVELTNSTRGKSLVSDPRLFGLDEATKVEEWEDAEEISLMHNEIIELIRATKVPFTNSIVSSKELQVEIDTSFIFNCMPALF